jgi:hypothetical protein
VFRAVGRPTYDAQMLAQLDAAAAKDPGDARALTALLHGSDTWTIN